MVPLRLEVIAGPGILTGYLDTNSTRNPLELPLSVVTHDLDTVGSSKETKLQEKSTIWSLFERS